MTKILWIGMVVGLAATIPGTAFAHCDALDGPVVKAARAALDSRDVTKVLAWVPASHEAEVRLAFERTLDVRTLGAPAQTLADTWFFETLVRIHRAGEGAPYDGLKPAGGIEPIIRAVDGTLDGGTVEPLLSAVTAHVSEGVRTRFEQARDLRTHAGESVEAGRRFVAAYVAYMHYVEGIHNAAAGGPTHGAEAATGATGHHPPR